MASAFGTRKSLEEVASTNVPSNFVKSVCAQNFLCATLYQHSSIYRTTCVKHVQKHFLKENLCALQVFSSHDLCVHALACCVEGTLASASNPHQNLSFVKVNEYLGEIYYILGILWVIGCMPLLYHSVP